jgi:hypothetical protein
MISSRRKLTWENVDVPILGLDSLVLDSSLYFMDWADLL